ncbi:PqqD family protein [Bacillus cereus]|nr:PqqD family protein [Bacillus cereus]
MRKRIFLKIFFQTFQLPRRQCIYLKLNIILLEMERSLYFSLDFIGSQIWNRIEEGKALEQICKEIAEEYDVKPEQVSVDIEEFCSALELNGLLLKK